MTLSAFDSVLENKIGFGRYQVISYITLGLTQFSDSAEIVGLSILLPVLQNEWHITAEDQGLLGTVLFLGIFAGSLLGGYVSDKVGRRRALLHASWVQFVVGVISTIVTNMKAFILIRGLFGVMIGFTIPLTPALVSEITPVQYRGRGVVAVNFLFSLGKVYAVIVAKFCLESLTSGNWRAMLIWCSFPSLLVWLGAWLHLKESPRFLIATGKLDEGIETLNYMAKVNNPYNAPRITQTETQELENWQRSMFSQVATADVRSLFSPKYKKITGLLWSMWFTLNFTFFGMLFILPFILSKLEMEDSSSGTGGLNGLLYTIAGEVPSIAIAMYIIEKKFFGRKNTIIYSNVIATSVFLLAYVAPVSMLIPLLTFARLFMKLNGAMLYPLTTEYYPTTFRTAGLGFASGVGRLGSALMPYVLIGMFNSGTLLPIFAFAVLSAIHGVAAFLLPYDTTGKQLDLLDESELHTMDKYVPLEKV